MVYYEYCFPETEEQQAELDRLRLECLLNLASCKLRTRQYDEVIDSCTQVDYWHTCVLLLLLAFSLLIANPTCS